jgi:catechol 2,3-dioxygenase-like lactoylglutathione lyase family enzyme
MAQIEKIGNVFYRVADMDAAYDFYANVLGLTPKFRDGDRWAAFDVAGTTFALEGERSAGASRGATVSLRVQGLDELVSQLRQRGAQVGEVRSGQHERTAEVTDPSGNVFLLYEPLPR